MHDAAGCIKLDKLEHSKCVLEYKLTEYIQFFHHHPVQIARWHYMAIRRNYLLASTVVAEKYTYLLLAQ